MATRKAPGAWGRGRSAVLVSAFVLILISALVIATAAHAVPRSAAGDAPGKSGTAPGHAPERTDGPATPKATPPAPTATEAGRPTVGTGAAAEPQKSSKPAKAQTKVRRAKPATNSKPATGNKQDWGPNQPVSDKYDGPCIRHDDTYRKGPGHDWHRGRGLGHAGVRPSPPTTPTPDPSEPPTGTPGSEPDSDTPTGGNGKPGGKPTQPGDGNSGGGKPGKGPWMPFTETALTPVVNRTTEQQAEPYLPFTGGDSSALLLAALGCALSGAGLRFGNRSKLHSHRRIAR